MNIIGQAIPFLIAEMFEPAESFRFNFKIRSEYFLRHPLQHLRMIVEIMNKTLPCSIIQLCKISSHPF